MASPAHLFGMASLALLLGWTAWEAHWQPRPVSPAEASASLPQAAPMPPLRFGALSDYPVTLERPLFFPGRQPAGAAQSTVAGEASGTAATTIINGSRPILSAIIVEGEQRSALLQQPGQVASIRVSVGERIGSWRLVSIEEDAVTLEHNGRIEQLPLRRFATPAPALDPHPRSRQRRLSGGISTDPAPD